LAGEAAREAEERAACEVLKETPERLVARLSAMTPAEAVRAVKALDSKTLPSADELRMEVAKVRDLSKQWPVWVRQLLWRAATEGPNPESF
jgi:hypothetical protein